MNVLCTADEPGERRTSEKVYLRWGPPHNVAASQRRNVSVRDRPLGQSRGNVLPRSSVLGVVTELSKIRNFSIIAHIDHGKSTLADRMLETCGAVDPRDMRAQYLDSMDIERERGITIKLQSVRLDYRDHVLHLIDTPGHVDFGYEVSRSLAACEGVVLVVDASQGIEAQTLANCYLALENDLAIVAVMNKIDLPAAEPERVAREIEQVLGIPADEVLSISAKTGAGVEELLEAVVERIPPPTGDERAPLQALIFDSHFDQYRGVVSSIRVMNGRMNTGAKLKFMQAAVAYEATEVGVRTPDSTPVKSLGESKSWETRNVPNPLSKDSSRKARLILFSNRVLPTPFFPIST